MQDMKLPKIDVDHKTLPDLLIPMRAGQLQIPRFQREFVWPISKTRALLDSIYKEFPIGTFFLWRAPQDTEPLFRSMTELGIPDPRPGAPLEYILDGQQRLASLYVVINGLKIWKGDYGRVCIDLEMATQYDGNTEEGFEQDIFVWRSPDNKRYIAVHELLGSSSNAIYDGVSEAWRPAFTKASNLLRSQYPFSVVYIQEQKLADAIVIFQRINQAGKRLTRYDLVCANLWTKDFDFRKEVEVLNRTFASRGFGQLDETIFTQTFALIIKDRCTTEAELTLNTRKVQGVWDKVVRALRLAVDFVVETMGVKRAEYLPYRGLLVVLAHYFYNGKSALTARERKALWDWFWRVTLSEHYSSTSPSKMAEDAKTLQTMRKGQDVVFNYPSKITPEAVMRARITSTTSALRNAFICILALRQPRNFKDGSPTNLSDSFFSDLKKAERHHVFPVGFLKKRKVPTSSVHVLPNFCFIPADLNREISDRDPATYLADFQRAAPKIFADAAETHLLPLSKGAAVWKNDFDGFVIERARRIAEELNRLVEASPASGPMDRLKALASDVDWLELQLRDFIDDTLSESTGKFSWKRMIPGDVREKVEQRITNWRTENAIDDEVVSSRRRLDFCDLGDYEKITLLNWALFGDAFAQKKVDFQRHYGAYRTLRNSIQHNRQPTDIEQKNGEAAMLWLQRNIDRYEREKHQLVEEAEEDQSDS